MRNDKAELFTFLNRDRLKHIVHLKMLLAYGSQMQSFYMTHGAFAGVLLLLPTAVSFYDRATYPATEYVVLISADEPSVTQKMLDYIPTGCKLVFKLIHAQDRAIIESRFPLKRVTSFLSYTCPATTEFSHAKEVIISDVLDESLLPLYAKNGYSAEVVKSYFAARQGLSFAIYDNDEPMSACLAYQNYENIWEIGGLCSGQTHGAEKKIEG